MRAAAGEVPEFLYKSFHVVGQFTPDDYFFMGAGMDESDGAGVQGLTGKDLEAVVDELAVAGVGGAPQNTVAAV